MFLSVQVGVKFFCYSGKAVRNQSCGSLCSSNHIVLSPILGLHYIYESQYQQYINNSLLLTSGCLFVFQSGSYRSPHVSIANTGRRTGQETLSRPLQGRCKPTAFLAALSLAGLGLYPLHLRLFRLRALRARDHLLCACFCSLRNKTSIFAGSP